MNEQKQFDYMFKLILIGAAGVGKSNILLKYTKDQFSEGWNTTIGVQYATKIVTTDKGIRIKLQIWDTAGQQRYRSLMKTFYRGASAAFIVYDVTQQKTFDNLDSQLKLIKQYNKSDIITMIVGNKIDMEQARTVSKQRGLDYAESKKIAFYEVSAKDGTNINLVFTRIAQQLQKAVQQPKTQQAQTQYKKQESITAPSKKFQTRRCKKFVVKMLNKPRRKNVAHDILSLLNSQLFEIHNYQIKHYFTLVLSLNSKVYLQLNNIFDIKIDFKMQNQGVSPGAQKLIIKKDFFIKSRKQDIRNYYQFSPKVLGRGAYGVVYKARLKQPPHTYRVVKLIAKKMVKNPESLQNQIAILRKLDHPMIVRLYETFQDQKNFYLVQDFCQGGQLFGRLEQHGNFNQNDARELFTQIIKCIKYMHSQKICHRDLKPQNFLMNSKKTLELKIIDFGLSYQWKQQMKKQLRNQKKNKLIGTSYYIAPQVLQLDYDQRCDIWSAGVILYILVTAAPPFDGNDDRQIMQNVKKQQYTFNIPQAKNLSAEVKDLISRILVPADKRITCDEIIKHPWMTKQLPAATLKLDFTKMRNFSKFSKFKTLIMTYIATQLPQKQIHHLGQLFEQIDTNSDGYLTVDQLQVALEKQQQNTNLAQLKKVMDFIDTDKNGKINYSQFLACCLQSSLLQTELYLDFIFKQIDKDKSGKISADQIRCIFTDSNIQTGKNVQKIIKECDKNNDGEIDYKQFLQAMGLKK